jgi:hypothetical protein
VGALRPQPPQAKFFVVQGRDVGREQGGAAGPQGVDELEVGDVVGLKDGVEGAVELLQLRVEPIEPCLRTLEAAGAGIRQQRTQDGNADGRGAFVATIVRGSLSTFVGSSRPE